MRRGDIRDNVGTASDSLLAGPAVPDTGGVTLDRDLSAEGASVAGVLGDFHLLDLLTERGTVTIRVALVSMSGLERMVALSIVPSESSQTPSMAMVGGAYRVPYLPVMPTSIKCVSIPSFAHLPHDQQFALIEQNPSAAGISYIETYFWCASSFWR